MKSIRYEGGHRRSFVLHTHYIYNWSRHCTWLTGFSTGYIFILLCLSGVIGFAYQWAGPTNHCSCKVLVHEEACFTASFAACPNGYSQRLHSALSSNCTLLHFGQIIKIELLWAPSIYLDAIYSLPFCEKLYKWQGTKWATFLKQISLVFLRRSFYQHSGFAVCMNPVNWQWVRLPQFLAVPRSFLSQTGRPHFCHLATDLEDQGSAYGGSRFSFEDLHLHFITEIGWHSAIYAEWPQNDHVY